MENCAKPAASQVLWPDGPKAMCIHCTIRATALAEAKGLFLLVQPLTAQHAAQLREEDVSQCHRARRAVLAELCSAGLEHVDASTVADLVELDPTGLASGKPLVRVLVERFAGDAKED